MDELSTYRCRIGIFNTAACRISIKGKQSRKRTRTVPMAKNGMKSYKTRNNLLLLAGQNHFKLLTVLLFVLCALGKDNFESLSFISRGFLMRNDGIVLGYSSVQFNNVLDSSDVLLLQSQTSCNLKYLRRINKQNIKTIKYISPAISKQSASSVCLWYMYYAFGYGNEMSLVRMEPICKVICYHDYKLLIYKSITSMKSINPTATNNASYRHKWLSYWDITSFLFEEPDCTVNYITVNYKTVTSSATNSSDSSICAYFLGTCFFLLGNKGCHSYNGNPTNRPGEAWMTPETLLLIKKHVDESVGYITTNTQDGPARATGFRVGDFYMMTAYHVFRAKIDYILKHLSMEFDGCSEETFSKLCRCLEINPEDYNRKPLVIAVKRVFNVFLKLKATDTSLLLQKLEGFINTGKFKQQFEDHWKKNCVVDFVNNTRYTVKWKVAFGVEDSDIIIVELLAETEQPFPRAMLLDENFMDHGNIHLIRYIHDSHPRVIMDQNAQEFKDDGELLRNVEIAVQWWKEKFPNEPEHFFSDQYRNCKTCYDDETGHVTLRTSKSFTKGASGSPVIYSVNNNGQPVVGMIFQRGHPEFYYNANTPYCPEYRRFKSVEVDETTCFLDGATTMKKAAQLLDRYGKQELKENIFKLPKGIKLHEMNYEDFEELLHTKIVKEFTTLHQQHETKITQFTTELRRGVNAATKELSRDIENLREQHKAMGSECRSMYQDVMDSLAQHAEGLGASGVFHRLESSVSSPKDKKPSVDMELHVKKWEEEDKLCYVTKGVDDVLQKISSDEHNFLCVVGVPGSGKSTAIRHAALHLKEKMGYNIYPIINPEEFLSYLDKDMPQLFIKDDIVGEYFVDREMLTAWNNYDDRIKSCLGKNTKFLTSLRIQLYLNETLKGKTCIYNDKNHITNLSDEAFRLSLHDMKIMLEQYLKVKSVGNAKELIDNIWPSTSRRESITGKQFVDFFPLLCNVFSVTPSVRENPRAFFDNPIQAMTVIFRQIKCNNKYQFCGLLLCAVTELKEAHFSPFCKLNNKQRKTINTLIKSQKLDPEKDLQQIKEDLQTLDGVFISRIGEKYVFRHSIFHNIVSFLYNDQYFVFEYATRDFIRSRVRLFSKMSTDDDYVLVFHGEECIELLVNRMIHELKSDDTELGWGARFIVNNHYIGDERLVSCLMKKLFHSDDKDITSDKIYVLFSACMSAVWEFSRSHEENSDEMSWPCYRLLVSLIPRVDCNKEMWWSWYPIHHCVEIGSVKLARLFVEHKADINVLEDDNISVLHKAVNCKNNVQMTQYLVSLPNLTCQNETNKYQQSVLHEAVWCRNNVQVTEIILGLQNLRCLNHRDKWNKTPYWWVVNDDVVKNRGEMIKLYKDKGAILSDDIDNRNEDSDDSDATAGNDDM